MLNREVPLIAPTCHTFFPSLDDMAENWEIEALGRRIDSIEREQERVKEETQRRRDQRRQFELVAMWTLFVIAMTTYVVLAATGNLHHH
jgi:hypothetical protein